MLTTKTCCKNIKPKAEKLAHFRISFPLETKLELVCQFVQG